jgi:hypothetical protein
MLLLALAACTPTVISSTPRNVTVDGVNSSNLDEAAGVAQAECEEHDRDAEQISGSRGYGSVTYRCVDRASPTTNSTPSTVAPATRAASDTKRRKEVFGDAPLFCAVTAPDVGLCFIDEQTCNAEKEKSGASSCEQRKAGACFNATKTLDKTKALICAASIKDCEARRNTYATDPDYTVTPCGIYRMK